MKSIAVFCGANAGRDAIFSEAARALAEILVAKKITIVYGGAKVGLMGVLADHALQFGGKVVGVIPHALAAIEIAHQGLSALHLVDSMHARKALMSKLADGFIMMPGGAGSLDEFFEAYTWAQLGYHNKPCGILNIANYYNSLIEFLDSAVDQGFIHLKHRNMIHIEETPQKLLQAISRDACATKSIKL